MAETEHPSRFPEETYILVRIIDEDHEGYDVEFEHSGFKDREAAFNFLKVIIGNAEEV